MRALAQPVLHAVDEVIVREDSFQFSKVETFVFGPAPFGIVTDSHHEEQQIMQVVILFGDMPKVSSS